MSATQVIAGSAAGSVAVRAVGGAVGAASGGTAEVAGPHPAPTSTRSRATPAHRRLILPSPVSPQRPPHYPFSRPRLTPVVAIAAPIVGGGYGTGVRDGPRGYHRGAPLAAPIAWAEEPIATLDVPGGVAHWSPALVMNEAMIIREAAVFVAKRSVWSLLSGMGSAPRGGEARQDRAPGGAAAGPGFAAPAASFGGNPQRARPGHPAPSWRASGPVACPANLNRAVASRHHRLDSGGAPL